MTRGIAKKIAVVTGGAGEIGMAVARRLLAADACVVLVDRDERTTQRLADSFNDPGVLAVVADVTTPEGNQRWLDASIERFGRIDLLHNNAGIEGRIAPIWDLEVEDLDRVLAVNVRGAFLTLQTALRAMRRQETGGSIVNSASLAGIRGMRRLTPYAMSKHAVVGLTRCAALEAAPLGIRVNAIAPGPIRTRMMRSIEEGSAPGDSAQARQRNLGAIPMRRYGEPDEVAAAVVWLLSDEASYLNGAIVPIDGASSA